MRWLRWTDCTISGGFRWFGGSQRSIQRWYYDKEENNLKIEVTSANAENDSVIFIQNSENVTVATGIVGFQWQLLDIEIRVGELAAGIPQVQPLLRAGLLVSRPSFHPASHRSTTASASRQSGCSRRRPPGQESEKLVKKSIRLHGPACERPAWAI